MIASGVPADDDHRRLARSLRQALESLAAAGIDRVPRSAAPAAPGGRPPHPAPVPRTEPARQAQRSLLLPDPVPAAVGAVAERPGALAALAATVAGCTRCAELTRCRTQTVFGVGNPAARLVFVGEAPGADEDARGEPFVGRAGQLLTRIITNAMKLRREDVYICNVLKCRPPENRTPASDEVAHCRGYLERQLELIRPEFICALGNVATQTLLGTTAPMSRMRGRFHAYRGIPVMCTYHPSYLLRNESAKRLVWEDIQKLMAAMGLAAPGRGPV